MKILALTRIAEVTQNACVVIDPVKLVLVASTLFCASRSVKLPLPNAQHMPSPKPSYTNSSWQPSGTHTTMGGCGYTPLLAALV